jgi:streptogramin lyase
VSAREDELPPLRPALASTLRQRVAPIALIGGGVIVAMLASPALPHERTVELQLPSGGAVTALQVAVSPEGVSEPMHAASWRFDAGHAPRSVQTRVSLPDGRYAVEVLVEQGGDHRQLQRMVDFRDASQVSVSLR